MILRIHVLAIALLVSASLSVFAAQEKPVTPVPVPKEMLEGTRLILKNTGWSVDLPAPGWSWMTYENSGNNFLCVHSKTFETYIVGINTLKHEMVPHQPESLIAGARKTQEARGGKMENDKFEFIETPGTIKTAKITFNEIDKAGKKTFACVYLFQLPDFTLIKMHCNTPYTTEPVSFNTMIKSLKITKSATPPAAVK